MKSVLKTVSLVLLFCSICCSATPYVDQIAKTGGEKDAILFVTWNAENFGRCKTPEALAYMAKVLRGADIVALEEISTTDAGAQAVAGLADDLNRTGAKWDYQVTDATHESPSKERYAFLWKTSRVRIMSQAKLISAFSAHMEREPSRVDFLIDDAMVSISSVHLVPTAKKPKNETVFLSGQAAAMMGERYILAGDFNLNHEKIGQDFEDHLRLAHQIEGKTSLKNKISSKGEHLLNEYDNIFTRGIKISRAGIMDFFPSFNDLPAAKKVSDHLPVFIVFRP